MKRWQFGIFCLMLSLSSFAQVAKMDEEVMHTFIVNNSKIFPYCGCPYDLDENNRRCGTRSVWSRFPGMLYCYPSEVPPGTIVANRHRDATTSPNASGIVTQLIAHGPEDSRFGSNSIEHSMASFVFNGFIYHPLIREGCSNIFVGLMMTMVNVAPLNQEQQGAHSALFLLPDGAHCLAMSLGPANF